MRTPPTFQNQRPALRRAARFFAAVVLFALPFFQIAASTSAQDVPQLEIDSKEFLVMNADTGDVFAQQDAHKRVPIASLTKIFTAVEAIHLAPLDTEITTNESDMQPSDATVMGFSPGETFTLKDLLYGMLLPSGNDAAHAIARGLGYQKGDTDDQAVQRFMVLINQRIQDMGLKDTHLVNPHGYGVPGHYSSAWDVATFMNYAMTFPLLTQIMGTASYTTANGLITVTQGNKMLNTYSAWVAGKTGYDDTAGWCLSNLAKEGNVRMIAVTLDGIAPDDWYDDNTVLLNYAFEQQQTLTDSKKAFTGDVVSYTDPAAAEIARSARPGTDLSSVAVAPGSEPKTTDVKPIAPPGETASQSLPDVAPAAVDDAPSRSFMQKVQDSGRDIAAIGLAAFLVLVPTFLTYRLRWGRDGRKASRVDTTPASH
jgi:D-alanyl-D-alanine carboxypeptidase (penicillin-binding protein 5/6)